MIRVGVIGGGISGLVAAHRLCVELAGRGEVTVYDAGDSRRPTAHRRPRRRTVRHRCRSVRRPPPRGPRPARRTRHRRATRRARRTPAAGLRGRPRAPAARADAHGHPCRPRPCRRPRVSRYARPHRRGTHPTVHLDARGGRAGRRAGARPLRRRRDRPLRRPVARWRVCRQRRYHRPACGPA